MDEFKERLSPSAVSEQPQRSDPCKKPLRTERVGVESRDAVLDQLRTTDQSLVVELDSEGDDEEVRRHWAQTGTVAPEAQEHHGNFQPYFEVIEQRSIPSSMPASRPAALYNHANQVYQKKRLFTLSDALEDRGKASSMPSPPFTSEGPSPQSSFSSSSQGESGGEGYGFSFLDRAAQLGECGGDFKQLAQGVQDAAGLDHQKYTIPGSVSDDFDANKDRDEGSVDDYVHLLSAYNEDEVNEEEPAEERAANESTSINPASAARSVAEASAIRRSQQLRAQRKARAGDRTAQGSPSRSSPDLDEIWNQRDEALDDTRANERLRGLANQDAQRTTSNPFTRDAANAWRTQRRHLATEDEDTVFMEGLQSNDHTPQKVHPDEQARKDEQARRDERLARIKANAFGPPAQSKRKLPHDTVTSPKPAKRVKFYAPDLEGGSGGSKAPPKALSSKPRPTVNHSSTDLRKMMGVGSPDREQADGQGQTNSGEQPDGTERIAPSLSVLNQLTIPATSSPATASRPRPGDLYNTLGEQGCDLDERGKVEEWSEARKSAWRRREILKERFLDLSLITDCFKGLARLLASNSHSEKDSRDLKELKRFAEAVIDENKSGKKARKHVKALKARIQHRNDITDQEPELDRIDKMLQSIMKQEYVDQLAKELPKVQVELETAKAECKNFYGEEGHRSRDQKRAVARLQKLQMPRGPTMSDTQRSLPWNSIEGQLRKRRAQLALFDELHSPGTVASHEEEVIDIPGLIDEDDDGASEEDEGEDLMILRRPPHRAQADLDTGNMSLRDIAQLEAKGAGSRPAPEAKARPAQAADQSLLKRMAAKSRQQEHAAQQSSQMVDLQMLQDMKEHKAVKAVRAEQRRDDLVEKTAAEKANDSDDAEAMDFDDCQVEVESEHEFDDSDLEVDTEEAASDEEGNEEQPQCKRYIVKTSIAGLRPDHEGEVHLLGNFLQRKKAIKKVRDVAPWFKAQMQLHHPEKAIDAGCSIVLNDNGIDYEQQVNLGETAACRTWIETELYNPSVEAYENAKIQRACQIPDAWFIDWSKTVEPIEEDTVEAATEAPADSLTENPSDTAANVSFTSTATTSDGTLDDDLFGPDSDTQAQSSPITPATSTSDDHSQPTFPTESVMGCSITERATGDNFRIYTDLAIANREAKDVFMHWFLKHLPGPDNFGYIQGEEKSMEEQLERIGNRDTWEREESFEVKRDGRSERETMRIWVRKCKGRGPSN